VKFETTSHFDAEWKRLSREDRKLAKKAFAAFVAACNAAEADQTPPAFPPALRVKPVRGARGIMEMTWHFKRPDGRATWEWTQIAGERAVRWRRIGGHEVFKNP
jgi:hypothetical protein